MSGLGRKREARRSEAQWRALVERQATSGLAVGAFCESEGVRPANFYRWRNLLNRARTRSQAPRREPALEFIDAGVLEASSSRRSRLDLKLDLGEGWVIHLARS